MHESMSAAIAEAVIRSRAMPVLVGFLAPACGTGVDNENVAALCAGRLAFVPVSGKPGVLRAYGVRGLPTYVLFHGEREVARHLGRMTPDALASLITTVTGAVPCHQ
jgi:thioredoxin-like negative regulator of GroEL